MTFPPHLWLVPPPAAGHGASVAAGAAGGEAAEGAAGGEARHPAEVRRVAPWRKLVDYSDL